MGGLKREWSYDDLNNLINYAMGSIPRKKMSFFRLKIKVVVPLCSMIGVRFQRILLHCPNHSSMLLKKTGRARAARTRRCHRLETCLPRMGCRNMAMALVGRKRQFVNILRRSATSISEKFDTENFGNILSCFSLPCRSRILA